MLKDWIKISNTIKNVDLDFIQFEEFKKKNDELYSAFNEILIDARINQSLMYSLINELGWKKEDFKEIIEDDLSETVKKGTFGELLTSKLLEEFFDYVIPIKNLHYSLNQRIANTGIDVFAFKLNNLNEIKEFCLIESKVRTSTDTSVLNDSYDFLEQNHIKKINQFYLRTLNILEGKNEEWFNQLKKFLKSRKTEKNLESTKISLIMEKEKWKDKLIGNFEKKEKKLIPDIQVLNTNIENLNEFIERIFKNCNFGA